MRLCSLGWATGACVTSLSCQLLWYLVLQFFAQIKEKWKECCCLCSNIYVLDSHFEAIKVAVKYFEKGWTQPFSSFNFSILSISMLLFFQLDLTIFRQRVHYSSERSWMDYLFVVHHIYSNYACIKFIFCHCRYDGWLLKVTISTCESKSTCCEVKKCTELSFLF